jgi:hypothetical protein
MRKRTKGILVCRVTKSGNVQTYSKVKRPYVRLFGEWVPIKESDLHLYTDFKIEYR